MNNYNINVFKLVGKLIGKAIFEKIPLNVRFVKPIIKYILG